MTYRSRRPIVRYLARYDSLVEIGIGRRPEVAAGLVDRDCDVTVVDVHDQSVPDGVSFVRDDIVERSAAAASLPDGKARNERAATPRAAIPAAYKVDAIYGLNLPAELQRPAATLAARVDADCLFTTLGFEEPVVPVDRLSIDGLSELLYRVDADRPADRR
ncbi:UPF0146 family protein [Halalkalirubrum salinum]|uniref:UPF0146 family protein n=1 Tax=Halalkalirubrum salinum TaxID=2563889 RepID=UPI0010FB676D|nr:UPF0146 family protein [Halalkalirubrum salinum]